MPTPAPPNHQIRYVSSFAELVSTPFSGMVNALSWQRAPAGDFAEIVAQLDQKEDLVNVSRAALNGLRLSAAGRQAREIILNDWALLEAHGASPVLNLIRRYRRDEDFPTLPTDVYSWHVDRSPVPTDTFLCTYHGAPSDLLPNAQAQQKILVPEVRAELLELYDGPPGGFAAFLAEYFFDLHYQALPGARPVSLGRGHLWRLAIDHPAQRVPPCVHRAPVEGAEERRLMMIC